MDSKVKWTRRELLRRASAVGAVVPVALLAACTQSTPSASPTPAVAPVGQTVAPATAAAEKVRLTYGKGGLATVAQTRGVFEPSLRERGIGVEWIGPFPNHAPTMQAVSARSADFSFGGSTTPALAALLAGQPLNFVQMVFARPREKVETVYMDPPDAEPAFATRKVDAWSMWNGGREVAEVKYGPVPIFVEEDELPPDGQIDFGSYLVRDDYVKDHLDTIRAVMAAWKVEAEWAAANQDDYIAIINNDSGYPPEVVAKQAAYHSASRYSAMSSDVVAQLQKSADWLAPRKIIPGQIEVARYAVDISGA
ncbi:MAG: aliphatic sulfonates ABC transporter substrate-binding protein [Chloroflexi bacterium]|nr:aliphatic sulfonates ABC transporter substrate-binding protein [Chloroflexota bacterium]